MGKRCDTIQLTRWSCRQRRNRRSAIQLTEAGPVSLFPQHGYQSPKRNSRGRWRRRWWRGRWWWRWWLKSALTCSPSITTSSISCLASRSTSSPPPDMLVLTSSSPQFSYLWGSRARVCRGAKLDIQQGTHLAIHSLEREAGMSACSPDPVEGKKEVL